MYRILRIVRITLSVAFLTAAVAGTLFSGPIAAWLLGTVGTVQIVPAMVTGSALWMLVWGALTLLVGRVYCSTVCPMGTAMDIAARLRRGRKRYVYERPERVVRTVAAMALALSISLGSVIVTTVLDPYADFMRMMGIWTVQSLSMILATVTVFLLTMVLAWMSGRWVCNTVCPVGALTGAVSTASLLHFDINPDLCVHCGDCEAACKSQCVDSEHSVIDPSRCVVCFNCAAACRHGALTWRVGRHRLQWPLLQRTDSQAATTCHKS